MTDPIDPALYTDLAAKHGDRMPPESEVFIRRGWVPLVDRFMTDLARDYPDVRILGIVAATWLQVDYALPSGGDHDWMRHLGFDRWLQRYVTESLSTCECCGSGFGRERRSLRIICDNCEEETSDAC
ncbi:hypothetical protein [Agrobacterium genomosp. 2]|jgi:hypothetical protein|uniref:Uncharacterized protein n=1 Tax=Agrobacterium genomosp. 2 str. CFBP 5494 TaxID=1183436 RepID=A0A9W5F3J0_9HYPH|nr:hypothetical protein [Agrobacterium genomosp. 2]CUX03404.1 hypothetical protein AGR2A_pb10147 [Agrobacterium genomosp. 2 str. CFBP 5494]